MGTIMVCYYKAPDTNNILLLGSGTILYEPKIIHGCQYAGHIEDIVVDTEFRKNGIAKTLLHKLVELAKQHNCYKIILDCKKELEPFYEKNGFEYRGTQMAMYL
jgi:glucosamine-phosphate N-acetyltransferase